RGRRLDDHHVRAKARHVTGPRATMHLHHRAGVLLITHATDLTLGPPRTEVTPVGVAERGILDVRALRDRHRGLGAREEARRLEARPLRRVSPALLDVGGAILGV